MFLQFTVESLRRCWGVYGIERMLPCISPLQPNYRNIKHEFIKKVRYSKFTSNKSRMERDSSAQHYLCYQYYSTEMDVNFVDLA